MSESSLPPFGPARNPRALPRLAKTLARSRAAAALNKLRGLTRRRERSGTQAAPDPLENRATRVVREYLDAHAESVERAARLRALRARVVEAVGREGARAFDRVVAMLAPAYGPPVLPG